MRGSAEVDETAQPAERAKAEQSGAGGRRLSASARTLSEIHAEGRREAEGLVLAMEHEKARQHEGMIKKLEKRRASKRNLLLKKGGGKGIKNDK
jgi:hypothetical protein